MGTAQHVVEDVVELLVGVEQLIAEHRDALDLLNVFPVPDGDTGRNVLATVRAARVGAEQAKDAAAAPTAAALAAVAGARGNAGVLVSQLLRALLAPEPAGGSWADRLARADALARAAVATPVEGTILTAISAAATAARVETGAEAQLVAAAAAAHAAVVDSPRRNEVLARAGVVDAGARAAALVLEATAAHVRGVAPAPPAVEVPPDGPDLEACAPSATRFEVMYLLEPRDEDDRALVVRGLQTGLTTVGDSVMVVAADTLVSVHVHTDDIGATIDVGLAHGRPHRVRVEDLHAGRTVAAARGAHPAAGAPARPAVGLVVGTDGVGLARMAAELGASTVPLQPDSPPTPQHFLDAARRTGHDRVLLLPGSAAAVVAAEQVAVQRLGVAVVVAADSPARVLAALAVLDPTAPDADALDEVAGAVAAGVVQATAGGWAGVRDGSVHAEADDALAALDELAGDLVDDLGAAPELATLLVGEGVTDDLRDAAVEALHDRWPDLEVDVVDAGLRGGPFALGLE